MLASAPFLVCLVFVLVECHPTMYKYNENKVLEPDLVPVSSTVIPLPVYKVGYGFTSGKNAKNSNVKKPEGPIELITVHTKKKPTPAVKPKVSGNVKHVSKKELREE
ncbi:unnamed protein product [Acanthoscelides obtectus]|uniref:Uncharacterized protein n=1 Tax=Acanthoscelides obtectus TaxID=200917 RepID=A0A9P0K0R6_ACAOB|nr:unnamed protein product [Acanthoscelides obtectus]CAK1658461.1 hypothetical protein AOBTE_LOCUS20911 [Acanthoscelides obtectus]